jgi:hypothetical protein
VSASWAPPWVRVAPYVGGKEQAGLIALCYRCRRQKRLARLGDDPRAATLIDRVEEFAARHIHCPRQRRP